MILSSCDARFAQSFFRAACSHLHEATAYLKYTTRQQSKAEGGYYRAYGSDHVEDSIWHLCHCGCAWCSAEYQREPELDCYFSVYSDETNAAITWNDLRRVSHKARRSLDKIGAVDGTRAKRQLTATSVTSSSNALVLSFMRQLHKYNKQDAGRRAMHRFC